MPNGNLYAAEPRELRGDERHQPRHRRDGDNPSPATTVVLPSNGATLSSSQYFDATASPGVTKVQYELSGGGLTDSVIAAATATIYGWLAAWNTTTVPNGPTRCRASHRTQVASRVRAPV